MAAQIAVLVENAIQAAHQERWTDALADLEAAIEVAPTDLIAWLTLAGVKGRSGDADGEFAAIQQTLTIDPYYVPGLLLKGNWYDVRGDAVLAATSYRHALQVAPPEREWPRQLAAELAHARDFVARHAAAMFRHLSERVVLPESGDDAECWREALSIRAGQTQPFLSNSNQLYVPRLPAIPFFQRSEFPFLDQLEAHTDAIRDELLSYLASNDTHFSPYIRYRPGEPVNQWQHLDHSADWSALHLWRGGKPVKENLARFPETTRALQDVALCDLDGLCPNVFFSALAPRTHIPPHFGESNARVIAHLPLIIPGDCWLRVGFEKRCWTPGNTLIFDDTLEHEAVNDSDDLRVVMIFDLWNPLIGRNERHYANALAAATREFTGA
jgi:aspartyl/asparaginyl beta-hydroxylase (cupin superfamily)